MILDRDYEESLDYVGCFMESLPGIGIRDWGRRREYLAAGDLFCAVLYGGRIALRLDHAGLFNAVIQTAGGEVWPDSTQGWVLLPKGLHRRVEEFEKWIRLAYHLRLQGTVPDEASRLRLKEEKHASEKAIQH